MAKSTDNMIVFDVALQWRDASGVLSTAYFSTMPRAGAAGDATSATYIDGRVRQIALQEWMFGPYRTRGPREVGTGSISLENGDGGLDVWASRSVHMCAVVVRRVNLSDPTTGVVDFEGFAERLEINESELTVFVRDKTFIFDKPARESLYGGTNVAPNGADGDSSQKGVRKPWMLGDNLNNIPLTSVNTSKLIYQVDGVLGIINSFTTPVTVSDGGVALTFSGEDFTQAALEASAPAASTYRVYRAGGLVKLGSKPSSTLTARLSNPYPTTMTGVTPAVDNVSIQYQGTEWHYYMALVARKVDASINVSISNDFIYTSGLNNQIDCGGWWVFDGETYLDLLNRIAATGAGGAAWSYQGSTITAQLLKDPSAQTPVVSYTQADFAEAGGMGLRKVVSGDDGQTDDERGIPAWRVVVKHRHNYVVLTGADVSSSLNADSRMFLGMEDFQLDSSDATVKTQWPNAPEIAVQSNHVGVPVLRPQAIADQLLALYKVRRDFFECEVLVPKVGQTFPVLGSYIKISHPRFGLSAGKNFAVIGRRFNIERGTCTLTVWG